MTRAHQLQSKLKTLKVGSMLDSLEFRLNQAQKDHMGHIEFLELMLEDGIQKGKIKLWRLASSEHILRKLGRLKINFSFNHKIPVQQMHDLDIWSVY